MHKLVDEQGNVLGLVELPEAVEDALRNGRYGPTLRCLFYDADRQWFGNWTPGEMALAPQPVRSFGVTKWHRERDVLTILGITPEELEKQPGWMFVPGAAYIRRLIAEGVGS